MKRLPDAIRRQQRRLFWDVELEALDLERHEDFVFGRVLSLGDIDAVCSLREEVGEEALRAFVLRAPHRLDRRSRRFFEVVFSISEDPCTNNLFRRSSAPLFQP